MREGETHSNPKKASCVASPLVVAGGRTAAGTLDRPHPLDCFRDANIILDELEQAGRCQQSHGQEKGLR